MTSTTSSQRSPRQRCHHSYRCSQNLCRSHWRHCRHCIPKCFDHENPGSTVECLTCHPHFTRERATVSGFPFLRHIYCVWIFIDIQLNKLLNVVRLLDMGTVRNRINRSLLPGFRHDHTKLADSPNFRTAKTKSSTHWRYHWDVCMNWWPPCKHLLWSFREPSHWGAFGSSLINGCNWQLFWSGHNVVLCLSRSVSLRPSLQVVGSLFSDTSLVNV